MNIDVGRKSRKRVANADMDEHVNASVNVGDSVRQLARVCDTNRPMCVDDDTDGSCEECEKAFWWGDLVNAFSVGSDNTVDEGKEWGAVSGE